MGDIEAADGVARSAIMAVSCVWEQVPENYIIAQKIELTDGFGVFN